MMPQKKVLVIDDDSDIIDLVGIYLEDDFQIFSALHADAAFEELEKNEFDLVVVDIYLPEVDGKKIIQEIRKRESKTPILAISGYLQKEACLSELMKIGVNDFVEKPFLLGTFLNTVNRLIASSP